MTATRALYELPQECLQWSSLVFGDRPLDAACAEPDTWIPVFELTVSELVAIAFGFHILALASQPYAIRYDTASGKYLAYPLYLMPLCAGLLTALEAWRDIWCGILLWATGPVRWMLAAISDKLAVVHICYLKK